MRLTKVKIQKFKKISDLEIKTGALNILVGANGSGKSSILQASHLASCLLRQVDRIRPNTTSTVAVQDLDYLPTDDYMRLGHGENWGNMKNSPSSKITFTFEDGEENTCEAVCEARAARNAGISVTGHLPEEVRSFFRGREIYFSGFIPGISGIPNSEPKQSKRVVLKACSFGDSNVFLRNALNLLDQSEINQIEGWLSNLLDEVKIELKFEEERDLVIKAEVSIAGVRHPIELLGTGYIQLIQIFCYVLLFKPKILLIDEPDIHLHPTVQEKLASLLSEIAIQKNLSVILTSHSPFIIRGAPLDANVYWIENGEVANDSREAAEIALGWGAFGKKLIIVSEDKNISLLKKLVSQWPHIERYVAFQPGQGYQNLMKKEQAQELHEALGMKFKILVHRDRDSLTDEEVSRLSSEFDSGEIKLWFPENSDIESYFCNDQVIHQCTGEELDICQGYIDRSLNRSTGKDQFDKQRRAHNDELYSGGGSPINEEIWSLFESKPLKGCKGKTVFKQLKNTVPSNKFDERAILNLTFQTDLATDLKAILESMLS